MRDRAALLLKVVCVCLAAWLAWELVRAGKDANPLAHVTIPDVPSLPADTNAPPAIANKPPARPGTNAMAKGTNALSGTNVMATAGTNANAAVTDTNVPTMVADTNAAPRKKPRHSETNAAAIAATAPSTNSVAVTNTSIATNLVMTPPTNGDVVIVADLNAPAIAGTNATQSNGVPITSIAAAPTNASGSNAAMGLPTNTIVSGTNGRIARTARGTNVIADSARTNATNAAMARAAGARGPNAAAMAAMMGGPAGRKPAAPLPPEIQARVDRVYESEIFAPVMHPMPMALLGVEGKAAFLRAPSGQSGLVKEGDSLGDIKLLQVGINRVLVEQDGKKQELMIFAGLGGESLLTKTNESSNETTKN